MINTMHSIHNVIILFDPHKGAYISAITVSGRDKCSVIGVTTPGNSTE